MSEINQQLAGLFTKFSQNLLSEENDKYLTLTSEADLAGLSQSLKGAAANAAASKKVSNAWVISNTRSSVDPFLTYSERRDLREKAWKMLIELEPDSGLAETAHFQLSQLYRRLKRPAEAVRETELFREMKAKRAP